MKRRGGDLDVLHGLRLGTGIAASSHNSDCLLSIRQSVHKEKQRRHPCDHEVMLPGRATQTKHTVMLVPYLRSCIAAWPLFTV